MNKIILMGRLTRDPETKPGETPLAKFSLAVGRRGKDETDYFNCVSFGKQAEFVERYLRKGTKVIVCGRMQNDNYTNKDGKKVYGFQIVTDEIDFCESKKAQSEAQEAEAEENPFDGFPPFN